MSAGANKLQFIQWKFADFCCYFFPNGYSGYFNALENLKLRTDIF